MVSSLMQSKTKTTTVVGPEGDYATINQKALKYVELYSKDKVETIDTSLPEASHMFYITTPANHNAGKIFPICILLLVSSSVAHLVNMMQLEVVRKATSRSQQVSCHVCPSGINQCYSSICSAK